MPTPEPDRIDLDLKYIAGTLADLEDVALDWDNEPLHVKQDWHMEWRNDMATVEYLRDAYERRILTEAQQESFRGILGWIQRLIPTIERLELDMPSVPLKT